MARQGASPRTQVHVPKKEQFWRVANPEIVELQQKFARKAGAEDSRPNRARTRQTAKRRAIRDDGN